MSAAAEPPCKKSRRPRSPERAAPGVPEEDAAVWAGFGVLPQRMAFYAGVWRRGRGFRIPLEEARAYGEALPRAIEVEHAIMAAGGCARLLTPALVHKLSKMSPEEAFREQLAAGERASGAGPPPKPNGAEPSGRASGRLGTPGEPPP